VTKDEEVLAYIGSDGRSYEELAQAFPGFDLARLVRAHLVESVLEAPMETEAHALDVRVGSVRYALTARGADALGVSSEPRSR
jgi:hypothetical protein